LTATLKALSLLLTYPSEDLRAALPEITKLIRGEKLIAEPQLSKLLTFVADLEGRDLYDLQERYVLLFDRTRSLSLHLFEHVHGEGRERGQAMVDLQELYEEHGLAIDAKELPDYLPLFLEFLSTRPLADARAHLGEILHIVSATKERLRKRKSKHAIVFRAIEMVAQGKAEAADIAEVLSMPDEDPDDLEALDRIWEDAAVTFGTGDGGAIAPGGGCPAVRDTLSRMDPPAAQDQTPVQGKEAAS
jgi:nitrate reductase delta subunit